MFTHEVRIRDISRNPSNEWTPPIGAMGGPPAHELYRDLVLYAGLRLLRDGEGRPWVAMQDGERRRTFQVPSSELRGALDRFRMRRNLRPIPESDLEDFTRIVEARISDPDIRIPILTENATPRIDPNDGSFPVSGGLAAHPPNGAPIREDVPEPVEPAPAPAAAPTGRSFLTEESRGWSAPAPVEAPEDPPAVDRATVDPREPDAPDPPAAESPATTVRSGPSWVMHAARSPVRTNPEPEPGRWPVPSAPAPPAPAWKEEGEIAPAEEPRAPAPAPSPAPALQREVDALLEELEGGPARRPRIPRLLAPAPPWSEGEEVSPPLAPVPAVSDSISGGRATPVDGTGTLPTYLRVLKHLVSQGGWLGTTTELARLTGEEPETVFASLLQYRTSFNQNNIVVATVEVEDGWRWLAVDRSKLQSGRTSSGRFGP